MKKKDSEFKINFWDLPSSVRLNLDEFFCKRLFDDCQINLKNLAKKLSISYPFVCHLRRGMYSIPLDIVIKIARYSNIPLEAVQENIISVQTRAGSKTNIKFPIKENNILASLVGHVFGDGYIGKNKKQFEYSNFNKNLIKEVKKQVYTLFGIRPMTEKIDRITYPSIVGEILKVFGAPPAPKIYSSKTLPDWILKSSEYKTHFLKAFFDDDGSVMLSKSYRAKGLNLSVIRHITQKETALTLLRQIKSILGEFEIYSGNPIVSGFYKKKDGVRVIVYINITDYQSLFNFYSKIGLTRGAKYKKLKKINDTKPYYTKCNERVLSNKILEFLSQKLASTAEIANHINKSKNKTLKKLQLLKNKNLVEITGKVAINRSYLWKAKEGNICDNNK